ncbi:MAG: hypothetical protein PHO48_04875 [Candidatus Gracilibacteria bacterium]|nr:hypothetical protein [Candidatus Gracilibacteria bacterium]MDD5179385.1 hypothetical protein [Candidatus Gracilibacteria bacterium]
MAEIKKPNPLSKIPLFSSLARGIHQSRIDLAIILLLVLPQNAGMLREAVAADP